MQIEPSSQFADEIADTPYTCTQCSGARMVPAILENEPDYTDNYICPNCQHHDTIPSLSNIASQVLTSLMGGGICIYLLIVYLAKLLSGFQYGSMEDALQNSALILISFAFTVGFTYVLVQGCLGYAHRRRYTANPLRKQKLPD